MWYFLTIIESVPVSAARIRGNHAENKTVPVLQDRPRVEVMRFPVGRGHDVRRGDVRSVLTHTGLSGREDFIGADPIA